MSMHPHLLARLQRAIHRARQLRLWWSLALCWTVAAILGLIWMAFQPPPGAASLLALLCIASLGLVAAMAVVIRHFDATPDWSRFSRQIEARHPELNGLLLTAVQQQVPKGGELNYFQERLVEEALRHGQRQDWAGVTPKSRLAIAQTGHWLALVLWVVTLFGLYAPENRRYILTRGFGTGIEVTPGDTSLERGSRLVVLARVNGTLPSAVELVIGSSAETAQRIPLVRSMTDPLFGGGLPEVVSNLVYHIVYDNQRTRDFKITVFEHPRLERSDVDLVFPEYTAQAPKRIENTRRVSAIEGSLLDLNLQLNKPVASARLVSKSVHDEDDPNAIALLVDTNRAAATLRQFPLTASGTYELRLVDADGRTNKAPALFVFEAHPNRPPELKIASPRGDLRPSPLEEIHFEGTVWDDFGALAYGLGYTVGGQDMKIIELGRDVPAKEKRSFQHLLRLEDLQVRPDQLVAWFMWCDDLGSTGQVRRTTGDLFFAEVRPFEEVFREGQGMGGQSSQGSSGEQGGGQAAKLAELQKQIMSATWKLQRDHYRGALAPQARETGGSPAGQDAVDKPSDTAPGRQSSKSAQLSHFKTFGRVQGFFREAGGYFSSPAGLSMSPVLQAQVMGQADRPGARSSPSASSGRSRGASSASTGKAPTYQEDAAVVRDSQAQALEQLQTAMARQQDPRAALLWAAAAREMEKALAKMKEATESPALLPEALAAEQAAYQALLKLQEHEYQVSRSRNQSGSQSGNSRQQQMQRQLDQMELTQAEDRYETQRQAQPPQSAERREQLQIMNRLQELARRQQDLNDRLKELQTALQEARTEREREEIRRRLKRLQEEEQQMLADVDELRQRMDRPENQSRLAEERRQLEQTRQDIQRAAEAASQGAASQALASGTRAQQQLQELRDQLRKESSSQFANDLREMRAEARELARQQEDLLKKIKQEAGATRKSLSDSPRRQEMLDQVARQRERLTNLLERATLVSQQAEPTEPLLSRQLYDTLRQFSQESANHVKEIQDELLERGLMTRNLYQQLNQASEQEGAKLFDVTSEMLRRDILTQATDTSQRLRPGIEQLKRGVERAAESILGDESEALRLASQELEQLAEKVRQEAARAEGRASSTNGPPSEAFEDESRQASANGASPRDQQSQNSPGGQNATEHPQDRNGAARDGARQNQQAQAANHSSSSPSAENDDSQSQAGSNRGNSQENQQAQSGANRNDPASGQNDRNAQVESEGSQANAPSSQQASSGGGSSSSANRDQPNQANLNLNRGDPRDSAPSQGRRSSSAMRGGSSDGWGGGWRDELDRLLDESAASRFGPITGEDFVPWSDRLREVEEMIEIPELRNEVAAARERARALRQEYKREGARPDWAEVRLQVLKPLVEVRDRIADELARRESREALAPIDRDPVPNRYSELVRRYYEALGKDK